MTVSLTPRPPIRETENYHVNKSPGLNTSTSSGNSAREREKTLDWREGSSITGNLSNLSTVIQLEHDF